MQLPRPYEAKVQFDRQANEVVVQPIFSDLYPRVLAYVTVAGAQGRERLFVLTVSGRTGKLSANEVGEVTPHFDTLAPEDAAPIDGEIGQ